MIRNRLFLLPLTPLLLVACAGSGVRDESSPFYALPAGSVLTLNRDVTIKRNEVAVYVQEGELLDYNGVDWYQPNCKFEIYTISDQPRQVAADSFRITRVVDEIESSSVVSTTRYAALNMASLLDHSQVFNYATMMYLKSDAQPDVYRMTCQHWEDIVDDRYLSIEQMRQAMGEVFSLEVLQQDAGK